MFNVKRNIPEPKSLRKKKKYNEEDVLIALKEIFHSKCYLCESKSPLDIHVEHFLPHQGNQALKFDWNNLYFVCSRCNGVKGAKYNNLLDCCSDDEDVFISLLCLPPRTPFAKKVVIKANNQSEKTLQTAELLDKIYNSNHTVNKKITSTWLRTQIFKESNKLIEFMMQYSDPLATDQEKESAIEKIKILICKKSEYSAFKRNILLEDEEFAPLFMQEMD